MSAGHQPSSHGRVQALDLLRLAAALMVVAYHYGFRGAAADGMTHMSLGGLTPVAKYASVGLQLFFVISGFVIAYSAERRTVREFAIARFARIYPGFLACMTLTFLVTATLGMPPFQTSLMHWAANLFVLSPALGEPFMDGAYWSIVYELIFYFWIAVLMGTSLFPRRLPEMVVLWIGMSLVNELALGSDTLRHLFLTDYAAFFSAGLMLYCLHAGRRTPAIWVLLGLSMLVAGVEGDLAAEWSRDHYHVVLSHGIVIAGAMLTVVTVGACLFVRRVPLPAGLVLALGGITYPLYLLHQHVGFILANRLEGLAAPEILVVGLMAAMATLAWAVWRFVERPSQPWIKAHLSQAADRLPFVRASGTRFVSGGPAASAVGRGGR